LCPVSQTSPRSTPVNSPRLPQITSGSSNFNGIPYHAAVPQSQGVQPHTLRNPSQRSGEVQYSSSSFAGAGNDNNQCFVYQSSRPQAPPACVSSASVRCLRKDLLAATDSVTNAMTSLVQELNSGK